MSLVCGAIESNAEGIAERWASNYRGKLIIQEVPCIIILDLQTGQKSRIEIPDSIEIRASGMGNSPTVQVDQTDGQLYIQSEQPIRAVWSFDQWTGTVNLLYRFRLNDCYFVDDKPEVTSSGDTVWGSMRLVKVDDIGFNFVEATKQLYSVASFRVIDWYPQANWVDSACAIVPSQTNARPTPPYDGSAGHWVELAKVENSKVSSEPGMWTPHQKLLAVSSQKKRFAALRGQQFLIGSFGKKQSSTPTFPRGFRFGYQAEFSPDGETIAFPGQSDSGAMVLTARGPDYREVTALTRFAGVSVEELWWTYDGEWIVAETRGMQSPIADYYAVEAASGERIKIETHGESSCLDDPYHTIEDSLAMPVLVRAVGPDLSQLSTSLRIRQRVLVYSLVGEDGKVRKAQLVSRVATNDGLRDAALHAARRYLYKPAMRNGVPVAVWIIQPIEFNPKP